MAIGAKERGLESDLIEGKYEMRNLDAEVSNREFSDLGFWLFTDLRLRSYLSDR